MSVNVPIAAPAKARYAMLAETLFDKISAGSYPVGSMIPTEADLCLQFGVSRTTVREAIRHLSDLGLVSRKPGVGTIVRAKHAAPRFVHAVESISDIFQYTEQSSRPVVIDSREIEAGEAEAELLQCAVGQRWRQFSMVRSLAGKRIPMVYSQAYVLPVYGRVVDLVPTRNHPVYTLLETEYGELIEEVEQEFRALNVNRRQARLLDVRPGSAGLYVIRHYYGRGERLLLVTSSIYPASRFSYAMRLRYNRRPELDTVR
jgi:GntR family transcriptional regulator